MVSKILIRMSLLWNGVMQVGFMTYEGVKEEPRILILVLCFIVSIGSFIFYELSDLLSDD